MVARGLSERRALTVGQMSASAFRYVPRPDGNAVVRDRIVDLAQRHRRDGAGMIYLKLRQAGHVINHTRVDRLYTEARLQLKRRRRKQIPRADRQPLVRPERRNQVWSADFVFDRTADGRVMKCLTSVDDATHEAVAIVPARAFGGLPVTRVLDRLAITRGLPQILRTACYDQVVKALGAVGLSNRGTDTGTGSLEPAHRASSGLIPEERRVPGGRASSCLRLEGLRTTVGMASGIVPARRLPAADGSPVSAVLVEQPGSWSRWRRSWCGRCRFGLFGASPCATPAARGQFLATVPNPVTTSTVGSLLPRSCSIRVWNMFRSRR